jgi:hypothetical protein
MTTLNISTDLVNFFTNTGTTAEAAAHFGVTKVQAAAAVKLALAAGKLFTAGTRPTGGRGRPSTLFTSIAGNAVAVVVKPRVAKAAPTTVETAETADTAAVEPVGPLLDGEHRRQAAILLAQEQAAGPVVTFVTPATDDSPETVLATGVTPEVAEKAVKTGLFHVAA